MRVFTKYVPILAILGTVTVLSAAPDPSPTTPPAAASTAPTPVLSVADMVARSAAIQAQLEDDTQHVEHLKDVARKQKDVIKLNCVNDRLVQIKAQRNIADETNTQLQVALGKSSDDRQQLFVSLNGVGENVKHLREQAAACIGEPELFKQESGVEVHHPEIPDDPTGTVDPPFSAPDVEPPGYASPFD
jgi:hypothetical protein